MKNEFSQNGERSPWSDECGFTLFPCGARGVVGAGRGGSLSLSKKNGERSP